MTAEPSARDDRRYSRLGKYEVLAHLASGGMGAVYKAVDVDLGREIALKILSPEMASKPALLERFQREARHLARLRHRNIVKIYEFGEAFGTYFLALEFVDGIDLYDYINRKGQLEPEEALLLLIQAVGALDHLHQYRMVHRDIKPSNFLVARENGHLLVKLIDLGLARIADEEAFRVTRDGSTVGTIDYMAPEQARDSGSADIRSDIYSLGCTWYHMLAGRPPFAEGGLAERLYKHLSTEPLDIRQLNPQVSAALAKVLRRMLAKNPAERYQTPASLLKDLSRADNPAPDAPPEPLPRSVRDRPSVTPIPGLEQAAKPRVAPRTFHAPPGRETPHEVQHTAAETCQLASVSPEQRQAAAGQFERAKEVITSGNWDYGIHLLLSCCKLDPANLAYRRVLRRTERARHKEKGRRFSFLSTSASKGKLKAAKAAHEYLKVLELGEELLVRDPWDNGTQMAMAEAAEALGLLDLAAWILKHAWQKESPDLTVGRALARLYETMGRFREAILLWEWVRQADPSDLEASRKARDLAAADTIARGQYRRDNEQ
jgi:serine/threonine protein kinase